MTSVGATVAAVDELEELSGVLAETAGALAVPGAVVGVAFGGASYVAAHGVTNVEFPNPITPATQFQIGSVTKTFVSAAVMVLVEQGSLSLEDPVARHLPELGPATGLDMESITIERALSHQAGFDGDHLFTSLEAHDLADLATARRLFEPGTGYSYNNAGFSIAGAVIEAVSGEDLASFVRRRLLKPLGLRGAAFRADDVITYPVASPHWVIDGHPYVLRRAGWQPGWELEPIDYAAGGLIASAEHLLTWARFQKTGSAVDGTPILSHESLDRLHTTVVNADLFEDVALDWFVRDIDGARSLGHGGSTAGYLTEFLVVPELDFAFVGLTNATNGSWVNDAMRRWTLARFADLDDRQLDPDPSIVVDVSRFLGTFVHAFAMLTVSGGAEPGQLVVTSSAREDVTGWQPPVDPPRTLAFVADDHAVAIGPGPQQLVRFGFDRSNRLEWLQWNGRRAVRA